MKRAVVLGGGGTVGVAWETGIAAGLKQAGIDLSEADLFVGTSAGSIVGTHLAAGIDTLAILTAAGQRTPANATPGGGERSADQAEVYALWTGLSEMTEVTARQIGALALKARTIPEAAWVGNIEFMTGTREWPGRRLLLTAVETASGRLKVWEAGSGVPSTWRSLQAVRCPV